MFSRRPLTKFDVIDRELERLHAEMGAFVFDDESPTEFNKEYLDLYIKVVTQVEILNKYLISTEGQ